MSFVLETIPNPKYNDLINLIETFELSSHKDSSCYEINKSEDIEKQLLDNIIKKSIENKTRLHII